MRQGDTITLEGVLDTFDAHTTPGTAILVMFTDANNRGIGVTRVPKHPQQLMDVVEAMCTAADPEGDLILGVVENGVLDRDIDRIAVRNFL